MDAWVVKVWLEGLYRSCSHSIVPLFDYVPRGSSNCHVRLEHCTIKILRIYVTSPP